MRPRETSVVIEAPQPELAAAARAGLVSLVLLSCGHFSVDLYSSALGALQPLLVERFHTSLTQAGILGGVLVFSASVMQPVYGYLSDRFHSRIFTVLAPAVAGLFISAMGRAPSYSWLLPLVLLGGTGVAAFHPQASSRAVLGAEGKRARAMAIFVSAGTLGYALGPTYFSAIATHWGLAQLQWAAVPGVLMTLLLFVIPSGAASTARPHGGFEWRPLQAAWKPLTLLYLIVFIRSSLQIAFAQFLPLYLHMDRGFGVVAANYALSAYLTAGAIGGFLGGHLADRFGGRLVTLFSMVVSVPFLVLFFSTTGWLSLTGLVAGGFVLLFTIPVNVVMAQRLAPSQAGTVSALMMGFAWGMAGMLFIPIIGLAADLFSLHGVLASLTVFPVIGFLLAWKLPR
jgi:FSR family fosmidomycin resistance protein-like MFS transporter